MVGVKSFRFTQFFLFFFTGCGTSAVELQPAPVSCDARFAAPCARTNSEWLATTTATQLLQVINQTQSFQQVLKELNDKQFNRNVGFYPFVFDRGTGICRAHGAHKEFVGLTIAQIFERVGITYSSANALHERFLAADREWVQYLWSDTGEKVHSKLAYIINVNDQYYLGVGYENEVLPEDVPCSDDYDGWCSLNNARSLVGRAQFRLAQAESLAAFENTMFRISFDESYKIPEGFYLFMYEITGELKAHGVLRDAFGRTLPDIFEENELGTRADGQALNETFVNAVSTKSTAWVQYKWRNSLSEPTYTKIAFLVKVEFGSQQYYVGAGFNFSTDEYLSAPLGSECSDKYNLPCSFQTAYQLSAHSLSHAISSPIDTLQRFESISRDQQFKQGDFYVFVYTFDGVCVAHGGNERFVGLSLSEVFKDVGILNLDANKLHEKFRNAASQGGGWVLYDWVKPGESDRFEKISYIFQLNIDGEDFYGGVGFTHERGPVEVYTRSGTKNNGDPIRCSQEYGLDCSELNAQSILGQALAELTLSSSEASTLRTADSTRRGTIDDTFDEITERTGAFSVNDLSVSVFSFGNHHLCQTDDGSGCAVAHGSNSEYVGLTWNEILTEFEEVTSIQGNNLHGQLIAASNTGGGVVTYPYKGTEKRAWTSRFRHEGESFYVLAEYKTDEFPETCDSCSSGNECTRSRQVFCEPIPSVPIFQNPIFIAIILLAVFGIAFAVLMFRRQKQKARAKLQRMVARMEEQMQGMFEIVADLPIRTSDEYVRKVGENATDKSKRRQAAGWYWEEDEGRVGQHIREMVMDGTNFVAYSGAICGQIEHAYKLFKEGRGFSEFRVDLTNKITSTKTGKKLCNSDSGNFYQINFETMVQSNSKTNFERRVKREDILLMIEPDLYDNLPFLPEDVDFTGENKEDLLPTYKGQVVQVSKFHSAAKWLYGNVLYDPLLDEAMQQRKHESGDDGLDVLFANALHDRPTSGWFPRAVAKTADVKQMHKLLKNLGGDGSGALATPSDWDESGDIRVKLSEGSTEYDEVANFFNSALYGQSSKVKVVAVHRIQNTALWQSYSVKKQTMRARYGDGTSHRINNNYPGDGLESLERRWLFHGTQSEVMPKIEKQGFNRSFAGRNAVSYGKGVYFARDASYSCHPIYSVPDESGVQHMFLCRVAVGDWSKGCKDQVTPEPKPYNNFELFDSTVDNVANPSIFVIYHDAQAYPEYLVSFKRKR